jgi:NNP family nitrate/nitrite transporter-like MFS transporter
MSNGATYGIVPFVNTKNVGLVSGIVGAGGNLGGMMFGFLFKSSTITYVEAFTYIGYVVIAVSVIVFITRFANKSEPEVEERIEKKVAVEEEMAVVAN